MSNRYTIVTGYWSGTGWRGQDDDSRANFFHLWYENTLKYSEPEDIFVINTGSTVLPNKKKGKWLDLSYNIGHVHDLDDNDFYPKKFCSQSINYLTAFLIAYNNNTDLVIKEQDCLAFNGWIERMYSDCENKQMVVGRPEHAAMQGIEQSVMLIKREFLLTFVEAYLTCEGNDAGWGYIRPEAKFRMIWQRFQEDIGFLSFGYGRARPTTFDRNETFYIQQISEPELTKLHEIGLL